MIVLSTALTVGYGSSLAAGSSSARVIALKGAGFGAGISGGTTAATQVGLIAQGVEAKLDIGKIALDAGLSFVTSLLGGKLSEKFLGMMTPRVAAALSHDKAALETARRLGVLLPNSYSFNQKLLADFVGGVAPNIVVEATKKAAAKTKGKSITMAEFIKIVVLEIKKEDITQALKQYLASRAR